MNFPIAKNHSIKKLHLDRENPRLPKSLKRNEVNIIDYLIKKTAIEDLAQSIAENGFFFAEALVAIPNQGGIKASKITDDTELTIVEGNRRLTALKMLQNPELVQRRRAFVRIAEGANERPDVVPIIVYENREAVLQFLGYRHITGVRAWNALAKARYIEQLFSNVDPKKDHDQGYTEVAQMVGSKPYYVRRTLDAVTALNFASDKDFFGLDIDEDDVDFSWLLTAIAYDDIRAFVRKMAAPEYLVEDPSNISEKNMEKLFSWFFERGADEKSRIVESRNIKKLASIITNRTALARFESGESIDRAYLATEGSGHEFTSHLSTAKAELEEASRLVAYVEATDTDAEITRELVKQAKHIKRSIENDDD